MKMINYNKVKEKVGNYIFFDMRVKISEQIKPLCEIILKQYASSKNKKILQANLMDINSAVNIVANFFKSINIDLYSSFLNILYDKEITKIYNGGVKSESNGKNLIINLENNTDDVIKICHESIHQIFQPYLQLESYEDIYQNMFTELNPITFERWLIESTNDDYNYFFHNRMINAKNHVLHLYFMEILKNAFLDKKDLNDEIIIEEINKVNDEFLKQILLNVKDYFLKYIQENSEISYIKTSRYVVAIPISACVFKKLKNKEMSYQEYVRTMQKLCEIKTYSEGLDILGLNYLHDTSKLEEIEHDYITAYEEMMNKRKR